MRLIGVFVCAAVILLTACGAEEQADGPGQETGESESEALEAEYRVVLGNAITDTLRGSASFGHVLSHSTDSLQFVIRLASGFDFAGGMILTRGSDELPEEGTYDLAADSVEEAAGERFVLLYHEGMLRDLRSVSGSLTLSSVTDSLIVGEFDAILKGYIAERGRDIESGEVHAVGRFRAKEGIEGYVIGL